MKKIIFYCLTVNVLLLAACKKDILSSTTPPTSTQTIYQQINPVGLAFVQLPANRYFIYKDSATATTDSVIVSESYLEKILNPTNPGGFTQTATPAYFYDKYTLTLTKVAGTTSQTWFKGTASSLGDGSHPSNSILSTFNLSDGQGTYFAFGTSAFWYPFNSSSNIAQYNFIAALTIEGITYTGVHQFTMNNGVPPSAADYLQTTNYWVKGIGIIKKEILTSNSVKTTLLLRYGQ